jgi:protein involved in sex pheromone biosynthesis
MKKIFAIALFAGVATLSACNSSPREQAADNIESSAEAKADNLEDAADNVSNDAAEASLENQAEAVRNIGEMKAGDVRTHDADTNLGNGI